MGPCPLPAVAGERTISSDVSCRKNRLPVERPLVLVEKVKSALRLAAIDERGLRLGLTLGLTLADARARIPDLEVFDFDATGNAALLERLADLCDLWSPLVTVDPPAGLILDVTGCTHLFGSETALCKDVAARFRRLGFSLRLALAGTPDTARALANYGPGGIIPPHQDAAAVRALPVTALDVDPDITTALMRAGLKTIGALADRPAAPFTARFGADLVGKLNRVLGREDRRITPRRLEPVCAVERRFAEPILRAGDIEGTLVAVVRRAAVILETRGEGGRRFEAVFFRTDGHVRRITVETSRPSRDPQALLRLYREKLEALTEPLEADFGFDLIRLSVPEAEPLEDVQFGFNVLAPRQRGEEGDPRRRRGGGEGHPVPLVPLTVVEPGFTGRPSSPPSLRDGSPSSPRSRGEKTPRLTLISSEKTDPLPLREGEDREKGHRNLLQGGLQSATSPKPGHGEIVTTAFDTEAIADLIDRFIVRFGKERVLRFMPRDTHVPEREAEMVTAGLCLKPMSWRLPEPGEPPIRPLHLFAPPQPVEDATAEVPDGPPVQFRWRRVLHRVAGVEGPERIAPEWWRHGAAKKIRDYYRVEDDKGCRFWLFREGDYQPDEKPKWFLHGVFA